MPLMPVAKCSSPLCPNDAVHKGQCAEHFQEAEAGYKDVPWRRVYASQRWKGLRRLVLQQQKGRCAVLGCMNMATDVDHIVGLRDGGDAYDRTNLQGLCKMHHSQKTRREIFGSK